MPQNAFPPRPLNGYALGQAGMFAPGPIHSPYGAAAMAAQQRTPDGGQYWTQPAGPHPPMHRMPAQQQPYSLPPGRGNDLSFRVEPPQLYNHPHLAYPAGSISPPNRGSPSLPPSQHHVPRASAISPRPAQPPGYSYGPPIAGIYPSQQLGYPKVS
jgi:hypothetical protein